MRPHLAAPLDLPDRLLGICVDYSWMGDEEDNMCLLAVKSTIPRMAASTVVESKGMDKFAKQLSNYFITLMGYKKVVFKSDNEPPILTLRREVGVDLPGVQLVPQEAQLATTQLIAI